MVRWQVPVVLAAVVVGTIVGLAFDVGETAERLVVPALIGMLALTFVGVHGRAIRSGLRRHPNVVTASFTINFVLTPLLAGLLGWLFLSDHADLRIGLVMLLVTPCTDWYLVFTGTARGNVPLAAALLPANLVLQLLLLPLYLVVLVGTAGGVRFADLAGNVVVVLGIPLAIAVAVRLAARRANAEDRVDAAVVRAEPLGLGLLALAIAAIFAAHVREVADDPDAFLRLAVPLVVFFVVVYLVATGAAGALRLEHPERVTLTMTTLARNSPVALAIAVTAFPDRPLVAVALVIGPLVELPILALAANRLLRARRSTTEP